MKYFIERIFAFFVGVRLALNLSCTLNEILKVVSYGNKIDGGSVYCRAHC